MMRLNRMMPAAGGGKGDGDGDKKWYRTRSKGPCGPAFNVNGYGNVRILWKDIFFRTNDRM